MIQQEEVSDENDEENGHNIPSCSNNDKNNDNNNNNNNNTRIVVISIVAKFGTHLGLLQEHCHVCNCQTTTKDWVGRRSVPVLMGHTVLTGDPTLIEPHIHQVAIS